VLDISTPSHPKYGMHYDSHDEMKRMLAPTAQTVSSVTAWLKAAGIDSVEVDSDWATFKTTVGTANKLLDTQFGWYVSEEAKPRKVLRTLEYSVPEDVAQFVNMIQPTTRFASIRANHETEHEVVGLQLAAVANSTVNCDATITPQCLKTIYKIDYKADAKSGSKVAFASYLEEYARYSDLAHFEKNIYPEAAGQNVSVVLFNGGIDGQNSTSDSGEANLDLQYIVGTSSPLPVTEFSTGGRGPWVADLDQPDLADSGNEPYLEFLQNVLKLSQKDLPQVISTSYGENEQSVPKSYALSVCNLFAQLGSRGVTVVFSSGDSGTGSACLSNDGKNTTKFQPQFPSYQDDSIKAYFHKLGEKNKPYFNRHGRGFPDVSAQGFGFRVYDKGSLKGYQGTSASAPAFAGIVALLNDARLRAKKPTLGFLNPLLYSAPEALNDIVLGGSTGCDGNARFHGAPNGSPVIPYASWNATAGWDPVSGLGTPNFPKLLKAALPSRYKA
jgi:tripeptidyl-peptidase-1